MGAQSKEVGKRQRREEEAAKRRRGFDPPHDTPQQYSTLQYSTIHYNTFHDSLFGLSRSVSITACVDVEERVRLGEVEQVW